MRNSDTKIGESNEDASFLLSVIRTEIRTSETAVVASVNGDLILHTAASPEYHNVQRTAAASRLSKTTKASQLLVFGEF
jgi:hypothetical protein